MKKFFTILGILWVFTCSLFAKEIDIKQAEVLAQNFYFEKINRIAILDYDKIVISEKVAIEYEQKPLLYIFNFGDNQGFVLVSAEDNVYPVLGYTTAGRYQESELPPAFVEMLENFKAQINFVKKNGLTADEIIKLNWQRYSNKEAQIQKNLTGVEPLLTSIWEQDRYYNAMCPPDVNGADGHARVGCVAVAMAQIMKYHTYPEHGTGSNSYSLAYYGTISADFSAATYEWDKMEDMLTDYNDEVAELSFHCGVAVEMIYGPEGSGAYSENVVQALRNYFNYSPTTHIEYKYSYLTPNWENLIINELNYYRPVYMSGSGTGGHAFVCDGYDNDGTNYFHFNWGWGGMYNGYYLITNLHPGTHDYSQGQAAIVGIQSPLPPQAEFQANQTNVYTGSSVDFRDVSTGIPISWYWTFEGGSPAVSDEKNPTNIVYITPGAYEVTLTISNFNGADTEVKSNFITVSNDALPKANFAVSDSIPATGETVQFFDRSFNGTTEWLWEFDPSTVTFVNGSNPQSQNPSVQFNAASLYRVSLTVTNANGSDQKTLDNYIYAGGLLLPFEENFEQVTFKDRWTIENPDGDITWDGYYKLSGNLPSRKSAWLNFYAYQNVGARDRLISPLINLAIYRDPVLIFKHAYAIYSMTRRDSLIIYISTNNGDDWQRIFAASDNGTGNFATSPPTTLEFIPRSADHWSGIGYGSGLISIDLTPWTGSANARIMFESYNGHGNSLYIDDLKIFVTQIPFVLAPIPEKFYIEDSSPQIICSDLRMVFSHPDTNINLNYRVVSDNEKVRPIIYNNQLSISFLRDYNGNANIIASAFDDLGVSASDSFLVTITPINDPPMVYFPQSIEFYKDTSIALDVWNYSSDKEIADSLLTYSFESNNAGLLLDYNKNNGTLNISSNGFVGSCLLYLTAIDDSNATAKDTVSVQVMDNSEVDFISDKVPENYELYQNYPNPFNAVTQIRYALPEPGWVKLDIYNTLGQKISTWIDDKQSAGYHLIQWESNEFATGVYLVRMQCNRFVAQRKIMVMK